MSIQWDPRRRHENQPGEATVPRPESPDPGNRPSGRPITRVDFFRRMPTGGTAYLKPAGPEDD
ncbi:hypothetical protein [Amycolatopsis viridis]|uniref:Uncharacterized protein n=1 Tax=Amycolatopsis viridis TaxID=185678 RepID=A0ABX0T334_9PSEU|nr:hypothetical protein [Amycolatopsis viridis]NIH83049.1 hypothetical protein [Amycolatopsis viridis]